LFPKLKADRGAGYDQTIGDVADGLDAYKLDARVRELAVRESRRIVRRRRAVLITETKHGFICANSGVDVSNVDGGQHAVLLPGMPIVPPHNCGGN